jgi:drug/metabolite transporter (DMT)-like permease
MACDVPPGRRRGCDRADRITEAHPDRITEAQHVTRNDAQVIAVLGGLGASLCWALSNLCAAHASRRIGAPSVVAWVMISGLVVVTPAIAVSDVAAIDRADFAWLAVGGAGNLGALLLVYLAMRQDKVGVVLPIVSAEGAVAAVFATVGGESLGLPSAVCLAAVAVGVVVVAASSPARLGADAGPAAPALAAVAAVLGGLSLYAFGHVASDVPLAWTVLPPRLLGTVFVAVPLAARRELRTPRPVAWYVVSAGVAEVLGFFSYALGARHGVAIAAVLATTFAAVAAMGAYVFLGEHLRQTQIVGLLLIFAAVSVLAVSRA